MSDPTVDLPYLLGKPDCVAKYNAAVEHFQVREIAQSSLSGRGDHIYLLIKKINQNTQAVANDIARQWQLKNVDVGYAGRKDRFAETYQWFSIHAPASKGLLPETLHSNSYRVVATARHYQKLRKGQLWGNHFVIQLTELSSAPEELFSRFEHLCQNGFANYFGPQRFGRDGQNLSRGQRMLSGDLRVRDRNQRSLYLSACRSYLFNAILAQRILTHGLDNPLQGERLTEDGQVLGPLVGDGDSETQGEALKLEMGVLEQHSKLLQGIRNSRSAWHWRPLKVIPKNPTYQLTELGPRLSFSLPSGCFATSLLRELFN